MRTGCMDLIRSCLQDGEIAPDRKSLFLNGSPVSWLAFGEGMQFWQPLRSMASSLPNSCLVDTLDGPPDRDLVLLLAPQNADETRFLLAKALERLREGGVLVCAAPSDAGGKRLRARMEELGLSCQETYGNHARAIRVIRDREPDPGVLKAWVQGGMLRRVEKTGFFSMPGLFGWDRVDPGSALLAKHLPEGFSGKGADFGCGYGYLARQVVEKNAGISELFCMDSDLRALEACQANLGEDLPFSVKYLWEDLTAPESLPEQLDWIVMNPPFHAGKETDTGIGDAFIRAASQALGRRGTLWMVANRNLPYEKTLSESFLSVRSLGQAQGFKLFCAEGVR